MQKLKEFATKQSMSEADKYMAELNALGELIEWFKEEVMRYVFLLHTAFIAECSAVCTGGPQSIEKRERERERERERKKKERRQLICLETRLSRGSQSASHWGSSSQSEHH